MDLDYNSLLLALSFAATGLSLTMLVIWLSARRDGFMLAWAIGVMFVVATIATYSLYLHDQQPVWRVLSSSFMMVAVAFLYSAADHFRFGRFEWKRTAIPAVAGIAIIAPVMASPWDGAGFIFYNAVVGVMLIITGREYYSARDEAPVLIVGMATLYGATGISFLLCALVLLVDGKIVLDGPPNNWAENLSLIVAIASIAGIGALSLSLNQGRLARQHRDDALTDALTGLGNRRALFDSYEKSGVPAQTAVVIFDLDDFKGINDKYGHAFGDEVLRRFAGILSLVSQGGHVAARMGGEEFCLILNRSTETVAGLVSERVRDTLAAERFKVNGIEVTCTVSAGVAFVAGKPETIDSVIRRADDALYDAKRQGRNRVVFPRLTLAS